MGLKNITLGEINQTQKDQYFTISLLGGNWIGKFIKTERKVEVIRSEGRDFDWLMTIHQEQWKSLGYRQWLHNYESILGHWTDMNSENDRYCYLYFTMLEHILFMSKTLVLNCNLTDKTHSSQWLILMDRLKDATLKFN